jgi:SpoIIAA-like
MEKRIRLIKHQEHMIMLIDLSHCTPAEIMALADEIQRRVAEHPHNSLLTLADFSGVQIDKLAAMRIKEVLAMDRPYVKRSAWVGTESLPHVFYENFKSFSQRDLPTFKTREEAMDWLVKE